jgi:hypothetical protein
MAMAMAMAAQCWMRRDFDTTGRGTSSLEYAIRRVLAESGSLQPTGTNNNVEFLMQPFSIKASPIPCSNTMTSLPVDLLSL